MAGSAYQNSGTCEALLKSDIKLVILDRDGVVNEDSDNYIKTVDEFILLPGSVEAIAKLNGLNVKVVIATNQSGIARQYLSVDMLDNMHEKLATALNAKGGSIDKIYYCPHGPDDLCACRKPKPGMIEQALSDFGVTASQAIMIGDSIRDLQSAEAAGVSQILVKTGKGQRSLKRMAEEKLFTEVPVFDDLATAINKLF